MFLGGKAALGLKEAVKSKTFFTNAIKLNKGKHEYFNGLGLACLELLEMESARQAFSNAIELEGRDPVAHVGMAESYESEKNYLMAAEYYYLSGTSALTRKDYGSALRSLAALERLPREKYEIKKKGDQLRDLITYNRKNN